ncbi:MAG: class I SAM-dependent methyltransferase [Oculatellaceae cyanobacterium Prado106]|jgi:ubiquinone/menaquinone biosynthesis C-methylase UbiE|nr:class I SAM-dependent methyltransferase [Oculatellaceae cyanobacterium Prado106]
MVEQNRQVYQARSIVQHYSQLRQLQPAEQTILDLFRSEWSKITLLDIGVGGGRTTQHFSGLVQAYMGIDYAPEMIAACQERFPLADSSDSSGSSGSSNPSKVFQVMDARQMQQFPDHAFDFILFSFNGIDALCHGDRQQVFQEVSRIGKPGGYFFFSSHNLQGIERELNWKNQVSLNPLKTYVNLIMFGLLRFFNRSISLKQLQQADHEMIQDESHNFRLKQYYVRPQEQLTQLQTAFNAIKIYSWKSGLEITTPDELSANTEMWLYYLCQIKEPEL